VSLAEDIRRVLLEHPEILVEVLTAKPEVVYEVALWRGDLQQIKRKVELSSSMPHTRRVMGRADSSSSCSLGMSYLTRPTPQYLTTFRRSYGLLQHLNATKRDR